MHAHTKYFCLFPTSILHDNLFSALSSFISEGVELPGLVMIRLFLMWQPWVCVCVTHVYVGVCTHVCAFVKRQEASCLRSHLPYFLHQCLTGLELAELFGPIGQRTEPWTCDSVSQCWDYKWKQSQPSFKKCWKLNAELRFSCRQDKHLTNWAMSPAHLGS